MNADIGTEAVEIGAETTQFPEKEYINGIFVAVHQTGRGEGARLCAAPAIYL